MFRVALVVVVCLLPAIPAVADCWTYGENCDQCIVGKCQKEYCYTTCEDGCVNGTCDPFGGGGECCGERYYSAVIYVEPGGCLICGTVKGERWSNAVGEITISRRKSTGTYAVFDPDRAPRMLLSPNQCIHTYKVVFESGPARASQAGGM